jgi:tetratricopeptide (TPR) repeat protein
MIDVPEEPAGLPVPIPFPSLHLSERVRGSDILEEHAPEYAQIFWESYRNVGDWAVTDWVRRGELFGPGAAELRNRQLMAIAPRVEKPVWVALEVIRDLLAAPARTEPRVVARACLQLSAWAGERGARATQFYFAAAAGLCLPHDAKLAYQAGCLAREIARWDGAEVWLEYAVAVARRQKERETQGIALLGLGNAYYRQGHYQRAKEAYAAALVLGKRHRLREVEGRAFHDLFIVAVETGDYARAEQHAHLALEAYGKEHPNVPRLAHDVVYFWVMRGNGFRALRVLEALIPRLSDPLHRMLALALSGRAAGQCGRRELFQRAWGELWMMDNQPGLQSHLAPALLELAYGAANLGEVAHAEYAAASAREIAEQRSEMDVVERVEALLDSISRGQPVEEKSATEGRSKAADQLAEELVEALNAGADAA